MYERFDVQSKLCLRRAARDGIDAAQVALEKNRSTFAVLPIRTLLDEKGYLVKLREKGYVVEEPG